MSSWGAIVARVKDRMETVADVGNVYSQIEIITNEEKFGLVTAADIDGEPKNRAWMISIEDVDTRWETHDGLVAWERRATIEGFFGDPGGGASETPALVVAEAVCAVLDSDIANTKLAGTVDHGGPCSIARNEPRLFAFVLAHYIRIDLPLKTTEQR